MIIGLHGRMESGKDTVFGMMSDDTRLWPIRRDAFADRLKVSAAHALGFSGTVEECVDFCNQIKQPNVGITTTLPGQCLMAVSGRGYLQRYGTEAHRDVFGTDFWVEALLPQGFIEPHTLVVTDVRFANEAERIHELGGQVWYIDRPSEGTGTHASEQLLPPDLIDVTIPNDKSLYELHLEVDEAVTKHLCPA